MKFWIITLFIFLFYIQGAIAAHYIIGNVGNALDGESANGHTVMLWSSIYGESENITDIVGISGNSGTNNYFMIDCELLDHPCNIDDNYNLVVIDSGDSYTSRNVSILVTGAGYDTAPNLYINSLLIIKSILVDDDIDDPALEIDLLPATDKEVTCSSIVSDPDGEGDINNASSQIFSQVSSSFGSSDDNNYHYTNSSCFIDYDYGNLYEAQINCSYRIWYYSTVGLWNCSINITDIKSNIVSNITNINPLLAINVSDILDFGVVTTNKVGPEYMVNITNFGNVGINLSLMGYGAQEGDGDAMNCSDTSNNISIDYVKFNLTSTNKGILSLIEFELYYQNLTSDYKTREFNLNFRHNPTTNDAINGTFWRIFVPNGVTGSCTGNIYIGAVNSQAE